MGWISGPAWCRLVHVSVVVEIARLIHHILDNRARVRRSVQAICTPIEAVVDPVGVFSSIAHDHLTEEAIIRQRLGTIAVPCVPVENHVAPPVFRGVRTYREEFAYGAHRDLVSVQAGDGHVEIPASILVEGGGLK